MMQRPVRNRPSRAERGLQRSPEIKRRFTGKQKIILRRKTIPGQEILFKELVTVSFNAPVSQLLTTWTSLSQSN